MRVFSAQCTFMVFLFCMVFAVTLIEQSSVVLDKASPADLVVDHPRPNHEIQERAQRRLNKAKLEVSQGRHRKDITPVAEEEAEEEQPFNVRRAKHEESQEEDEEEEEMVEEPRSENRRRGRRQGKEIVEEPEDIIEKTSQEDEPEEGIKSNTRRGRRQKEETISEFAAAVEEAMEAEAESNPDEPQSQARSGRHNRQNAEEPLEEDEQPEEEPPEEIGEPDAAKNGDVVEEILDDHVPMEAKPIKDEISNARRGRGRRAKTEEVQDIAEARQEEEEFAPVEEENSKGRKGRGRRAEDEELEAEDSAAIHGVEPAEEENSPDEDPGAADDLPENASADELEQEEARDTGRRDRRRYKQGQEHPAAQVNDIEAKEQLPATEDQPQNNGGGRGRRRGNNNNNNNKIDMNEPPAVDDKTLDAILDPIIARWDFSKSKNAKSILRGIWRKDNHYDRDRDLVVFFHPLKTGGTSVSRLLEKLGDTVPGSHESGSFGFELFDYQKRQKALAEGAKWNEQEWKDNMKSLFSHTPLREYGKGLDSTHSLHKFLLAKMPERRLRQITMVREPLAFAASNFNEWKCTLNKWAKEAKKQKLPKIPEGNEYYGCDGYTLEMLAKARIARNQEDCKDFTLAKQGDFDINLRRRCKAARRNDGDHMPECSSISKFLDSPGYKEQFHDHRAYERCTINITETARVEDYAEGALSYLGGLEAPEKDGYLYGDMMWIGITERMKESMCLLHYQLRMPWEETPTARMQSCRPTEYWAEPDRKKFYEKETMMMAVHRAANAVLDVQLAKMRYHVAHLKTVLGENADFMDYIGEGCLEMQEIALAED